MSFSDYLDDFEDIRPYTDEEMRPVLKRITQNEWLVSGVRRVVFPRCPDFLKPLAGRLVKFDLRNRLRRIKTIEQFQRRVIIDRVMEYVIKKTFEKVTISGDELLDPHAPYLFVSNHRDIVLDSALVNYVMVRKNKTIAEIAFGDNLMVNEFVSDLIRINRSFIVRRDGPLRQRAEAALTLSRYINYTMEQGHSVWVAQREGRAKDGDDRTNPSVVKMLYLGPRREKIPFGEFVERARIVPVAISYEFDPCDVLKAREVHRRSKSDTYKKRKDEDLLSMYAGLRGWKGRVHISFSKPIEGHYANAVEVAERIDRDIHDTYRLWPNNYIAYDELHGEKANADQYSADDVSAFMHRFRRESADVRSLALRIYATAVSNKLNCSPA